LPKSYFVSEILGVALAGHVALVVVDLLERRERVAAVALTAVLGAGDRESLGGAVVDAVGLYCSRVVVEPSVEVVIALRMGLGSRVSLSWSHNLISGFADFLYSVFPDEFLLIGFWRTLSFCLNSYRVNLRKTDSSYGR
jgi:hypothetical protein